MIDGRFWDKLEELGRLIRSSGKPFGGIQLVLYVSPLILVVTERQLTPSPTGVAISSSFHLYQTGTIEPRSLRSKRRHGTSVFQRYLR